MRKLRIIGITLTVLGILGYSFLQSNQATEAIDKSWDLTAKDLTVISIEGAEQDLDIQILPSDDGHSSIRLKGEVSKKTYKLLEKSVQEGETQKIVFNDLEGVQFIPNSIGKDTVDIVIKLDPKETIDSVNVHSMMGNIDFVADEQWFMHYELDTKDEKNDQVDPIKLDNQNQLNVYLKSMGDLLIKGSGQGL